ncbi:MAG: oligosaccharide repeat unit polymerase [Thermaceae bacterium]|nr:oligosaccharide repeat unit polymerase [Thermaceae bacterium]
MKLIPLVTLVSPWNLFIASWGIQLTLYLLNIAEFLPTGSSAWSAIFSLVLISAGAFLTASLIGYLSLRSLNELGILRDQTTTLYQKILSTSKTRTRWAALALMVLIGVITIANWRSYGPLPAITILTGANSEYTYLNYGRLMYVVFSAAMLLGLLSLLERSKLRAALMIGFAIGTFLVYVSRGFLIQAVIQYILFWIFMRRPKLNLRTFLAILSAVVIIGLVLGWIGSIRTGTSQFISAMRIRQEWQGWPSGVLWAVGYISFPLANMIALYNSFRDYTGGVLNLTASIPPIFWGTFGLEDTTSLLDPIIRTYFPNPLNTVATYNGWIFIDFGIWGVFIFNFFLGLFGSLFYMLARMRGSLVAIMCCSIFISCLILGVFANLFLNATILTQFFLAILLSIFLRPHMVDVGSKIIKVHPYA